jgi:oligoendopeptidase F
METMMSKTALPLRSEIRQEETWNAASVFPSQVAWETEYQAVQARLPTVSGYAGKLSQSADTLAAALDTFFQTMNQAEKLYIYASFSAKVDSTDQTASALASKGTALIGQVLAAGAFLKPEILALDGETLRRWLREHTRLAVYTHYCDDLLRQQAHIRSPEVEELLGQLTDPFSTPETVDRMLTVAEMHFAPARSSAGQDIPVAHGTILSLLSEHDRNTRRTAWEHYTDGYLSVQQTLASNLTGSVKQFIFLARARGYSSALEAAQAPHNIPVKVFHQTIQTFRAHQSIWHRYWALRRRVFALDTGPQYSYDLRFPFTRSAPAVSYAQAVDWISEGLQPLGQEYVEILRRGCLQERWVDRSLNQGKYSGAFSSGCPGMHPFIMMSYHDSLKAMSTLAHELGHSLHSYLTWKTQPMVYCRYSLFVAEVASNFHQALVRDYLLRTQTDPDLQIALLDEAMSNFHRYYFTMPMLARLELAMYEWVERGESLTADLLNSWFAEFLAEGYGGEVVIDPARDGITWATFGHLYEPFYVYQYTTGIAGAHTLAHRVLSGDPQAADRYLNFLRSGHSLYPLDALKQAGVDLRTPEPLETTFAILEGYIQRLERLLA